MGSCQLSSHVECKGAKVNAIRRGFVSMLAAMGLMAFPALAYADVAVSPLDRLGGEKKAIVLAALAGLVILGFGMVALIWLGARYAQHYRHGSSTFEPTTRPSEHDWAKKPLSVPENPPSTDH